MLCYLSMLVEVCIFIIAFPQDEAPAASISKM